MAKKLATEAYKGTRDFYPKDMAIQRYIFDTWAKTAESFGFERYDASILEPSDLYKSKGAENEEMVNEQTYTFIDRGDREVTLRPEMTPTVARMIAARRRDLNFPVRWYSIPNLFRYERPQRGRLREHWQLNCDMFGIDDIAADVEIISLAYNVLKEFGAEDEDFEIRINSRAWLTEKLKSYDLDENQMKHMIQLIDKKDKIKDFEKESEIITGQKIDFEITEAPKERSIKSIIDALNLIGITNIKFSPTIVRGFNYYTGTVFEIFDTNPKNNRSLIGGGRYDNLTELFGGDAVTGIGFGMGDVTMRDFLETHKLLPKDLHVTAPRLSILPMGKDLNIACEKIAHTFRTTGVTVSVDLSDKKIGKKISSADDAGVQYVLVVGEDELSSQNFTLKELATKEETAGQLDDLIKHLA
ncbi:MAG: histidine--tRNA ligase [Candidatus Pacebacteria bacterium]|nr:histidine--tRNA ligase [Candidatus Paceibacterota bacterium]MCF7857208.1 histidine--tRNA ligase [Candidatus Paceibacterota bacterium]